MTVPPLGLISPVRVAASEMLAPTVTVAAETWVARVGVFFSTVVFSLVSRQAPLAALLLASPE